MDEIKRELTFEEEADLYRTEVGWILAEEKPGAEPPFVNNVLRRGLRLIKLALERIDFLKLDVDYYKFKLEKLPQNGWISVKDRLPEKSGTYIVHSGAGGRWNGRSLSMKVSNWMPLPEPPKEDEDAKAD